MISAYILSKSLFPRSSDALNSTDLPTLRALLANPSSSAHIFVALNNATHLSNALTTPLSRIHELDWWDERLLRVALPSTADGPAVNAEVRLSCTPSQHVSGRTPFDRWHALWGAWFVDDLHSQKKVYFAGDTGYRTVHDGEDEEKVPVCPAFAEVGERFGGVDIALLPIGYAHLSYYRHTPTLIPIDVTVHIVRARCGQTCIAPLQMLCEFSRT
jgi:L-ascorbate metabolism protein UlaG (beta-lactamase superfamily)